MAKCKECGRKGLFFKVNSNKLCSDCQKHREILNATVALEEKRDGILRTIDQLQDQLLEKRIEYAAQTKILEDKYEALKKEVLKEAESASKMRNFAKSIQACMKVIHDDNAWNVSQEELDNWRNVDIDEFLSSPDLQCLSVKELAAKYRRIRKDIGAVCKAYEQRYTSKTISALYKLMVLALEAEFENILYTLQFGKLDAGIEAVKELTIKYYAIVSEGNQSIAPSLKRFILQIESLYLEALKIEHEYYVQRERAKEEQRAIREQMRQEAEERKRLEQERRKVDAEEEKYRLEIERITAQMQQAHDSELEKLRRRLEEVNALMDKVEEKKNEIINLQNGKAGTVYIISNIGSFGDHVFKVGMTRRLEPQDRVNELGDASVPFPFDVHSFIFSEDAVALETALHHELDSRRVNKVNLRKEFFDVSIEELQAIVERIDPTAPFKVTALAEQYRQSQSIAEQEADMEEAIAG